MSKPLFFKDLVNRSVYYNILVGKKSESEVNKILRPIYGPSDDGIGPPMDYGSPEAIRRYKNYVTMTSDGRLAYYAGKPDGKYEANDGRGEFIQIKPPGRDFCYVHYSRVFQPTEAARKQLDALILIMGITYEASADQIAYLNDCIAHSEALNEIVSKIIGAYAEFTVTKTNIDSANTNRAVYLSYAELEKYLNLGLAPAQTEFVVSAYPRPVIGSADLCAIGSYGDATSTNFIYPSFDFQTEKVSWHVENLVNNRKGKSYSKADFDSKVDAKIKAFCREDGNTSRPVSEDERARFAQAYIDQFGDEQFDFEVTVKRIEGNGFLLQSGAPLLVYDTVLKGGFYVADRQIGRGKEVGWPYEKVTDKFKLDPAIYAVKDSLKNIKQYKKTGVFLNEKGLQSFTDLMRTTTENLNNRQNAIGSIISSENFALQQNYSIGTNTVESLGEQKQKIIGNLR